VARGLEPAGVAFVAENIDGFVRDLGKADEAQDELVKSTKELDWTYRDASGRLRDVSGKFVKTGDSAEVAGRQMGQAEGAVGKFGQSFSMLGSIVTGVATAMTTFAIQAVAKMGQALVGLAQDSIGLATDFESSMAVLTISASGVEEELVNLGFGMEDLSEITLAVGGDTRLLGVSASGSAEAITGLFKAGLTAQDVFGDLQGYMAGTADLGGALRASIDLAAATTLDMAQASDLAAIALSTFGGQAEEAGMTADEFVVVAMDNLVRAADASVAEVEGLAEALKMVGPTAGAMSISIQDTNNALALLSTRGIQGSMAGTSLNRMLLDLGKTTPKATAAMEELGIVTYDEQGAMLPLVDIIGQFEIALGDATDAERDAALQAIFTAQGMRSMNVLMGEGIDGWVGMEEAIEGAASMMEQGEARAETYAAQQEALDGVMETLKIRIGTALLPALTSITTAFSGLVEKYGPMVSAAFEEIGAVLGDLVNWFIVLLEEGDPLNDFLANLPGAFQSIIKTVTELGKAFEPLYNAIVFALGGDIMGLMEGVGHTLQNLFGDEISRNIMVNFVDPIIEAVGTVIEVVGEIQQWFVDNGPAIRSALSQIGQVFEAVFGSIWKVIQDTVIPAFKDIGASFGEIWEAVKGILEEFGVEFDESGSGIETVVGIIVVAIEILGAVISGVLGAATSVIKFFAETFGSVLGDIREYIAAWKEQIQGFKDIFTGVFEGDWQKVIKGFGKVFTNAGVMFRKTVKLMIKYITKPFEGLYKLIEGFVKGVLGFFKDLKKKLVGGSIIPDMMDKIEKVIVVVLEVILKIWEKIFEKILDTTEKVFESIERIVDRVMSAIEKIIDTITTAIGGDWEDFVDLLFELWEDTWDDIRDFVDTVFNAIEALIDRIAGDIESLWVSFTGALEEVWENVWGAIETFVDTTFSNIETLINTVSGNIQEAWETFTGAVQEAWETVWGAIETFVDTTFGNIETFIGTVSGNIETAWETFTSSVQSTWETVWAAIETFVDTTFNGIETLIGTISGSIETAWGIFTGLIQSVWETAWGAIETFVNTTFGSIETAIETISSRIESTWDTWVGNLRSAFETMFNALEGIVNMAMGLVSSAVESALSALADILAFGSTLYNNIMNIGYNIANSIRDGLVTLWTNVTGAIATKLEALGAVGTFALTVWQKVQDLGEKIVNMIKSGLTTLWGAATGIVGTLRTKLEGLIGAIGAGTWWEKIKEIGGKILTKIMAGVKAVTTWASDFWSWLWGEILDWLRWHSGEEVGDMMGDKITDGLVDSIRSQTGVRLLDALDYATGKALRDVGFQVPVQLSAAMQGGIEADMMQAAAGFSASLGLVAPAMMAPAAVYSSTEVTIGPNYINDGMDLAEFEVRVRQAVSEAI